MVDAAYAEGWDANGAGYERSGNPYTSASEHYRLADMLAEAWQLGWIRAELARELKHHQATVRHQFEPAVTPRRR